LEGWDPFAYVSGITNAQSVTVGNGFACAVLASGGVECWGWEDYGELGNGKSDVSPTPVAMAGLSGGVRAINAGNLATCAVLATGRIECWGVKSFESDWEDVTPAPTVIGAAAEATAVSTPWETRMRQARPSAGVRAAPW